MTGLSRESVPAKPRTAPSKEPETQIEEQEVDRTDSPWTVILYNDDVHTFEEVTAQLVKATGCSVKRAKELTLQVHHHGKANVYEDRLEPCLKVQSILQEIQLMTEIKG
ncbi:MAG: ATP-dependent Clp protease adaptor ClpS [Balneolaceae bacterium]